MRAHAGWRQRTTHFTDGSFSEQHELDAAARLWGVSHGGGVGWRRSRSIRAQASSDVVVARFGGKSSPRHGGVLVVAVDVVSVVVMLLRK